jgi:hypothetical protein
VPGRATCPQMQIGKPSLPEHGAIASQHPLLRRDFAIRGFRTDQKSAWISEIQCAQTGNATRSCNR